MRIISAESLRFPEEGSSAQGKSGPKPRPKGVGDGQQVENPVPPHFRLSNGGTQEGRESRRLEEPVQAKWPMSRQIRSSIGEVVMAREMDSTEVPDPTLPRKASSEG